MSSLLGIPTVNAAVFLYAAFTLWTFTLISPRRAIILAFIVGTLFLPMYTYVLPSLPDIGKGDIPSLVCLVGVAVFDSPSLLKFRPKLGDMPAVLWCLTAAVTSSLAGDPYYQAWGNGLAHAMSWGIPYFLGRIYFTSLEDVRDLALGIVAGAVVYAPLCIWEARMSPDLHERLYGFSQHGLAHAKRFDGWRPVVFMQYALSTGLYMGLSAAIAVRLWMTRAAQRVGWAPMFVVIPLLIGTTLICKDAFAIVLMAIGIAVGLASVLVRSRVALLALLLVPPVYIAARTAGGWSGKELVTVAGWLSDTPEESIRTRVEAEEALWAHARKKIVFGHGASARNRVYKDNGRAIVTDALWIIMVGKWGLVGLTLVVTMLLLGPYLLHARLPDSVWSSPAGGAASALAVAMALHMCDNLLNMMITPYYVLTVGACAGVAFGLAPRAPREARASADQR